MKIFHNLDNSLLVSSTSSINILIDIEHETIIIFERLTKHDILLNIRMYDH